MAESGIVQLKSEQAVASVYVDPFSARIRMDDYEGRPEAVLQLIQQHIRSWVEKIILKVRKPDREGFLHAGFMEEASVAGYFNGEDMHFMVQYPDSVRGTSGILISESAKIMEMVSKAGPGRAPDLSIVSPAGMNDAEELSALFKQVFQVYPTPVEDPSYIRKTMLEGTIYYLIRFDGRVVSAGSAEVNRQYNNAELTDCATLTEASGNGYMLSIMSRIDHELIRKGIRSRYSIARSMSYPVNVVFHRLGFSCSGCLSKNVKIETGLEDMNVWTRFDG